MNQESTVYVVDDDKEVTESLRYLIESSGYCVEAYNDAETFLQSFSYDKPSCLVLDVRMPHMSGLELQEVLNDKRISVPIIFITGHGDVSMAVRSMKNGAVDFLCKPVNNQILLESINKAIKQDLKLKKNREVNVAMMERIQRLTAREQEVMEHIVAGKSTKGIAEELGISVHTVELHRAKVMRKMEAKTVAELVNFVLHVQEFQSRGE